MSNTQNLSRSEAGDANFRRDFLRGVTVAAGAAVTAAVVRGQNPTTPTAPSPANDLNLLNYALTLELLEATFYTQGLARFSSADFANSTAFANLRQASGVNTNGPASGATDTGLVQDIYAYLTLIRNHEQQHVRTLTTTIRSLGGTPVAAPNFRLTFTTADEFLSLAATLENTGVAAYNGAIAQMFNPALVTASATIASVEARHASYLNRIRGMVPFPDAFDAGKSVAEILAIAAPFLG